MRSFTPVPLFVLAAISSFGCTPDRQERTSGRGAGGGGGGDQGVAGRGERDNDPGQPAGDDGGSIEGDAGSADDEEGEPGDVNDDEDDDAGAEGDPSEEGGDVGEGLDQREGGGDDVGQDEGGEGDAVDPQCPPGSEGTEGCQCFWNATCGGAELICENDVCVPRPPGLPFGSLCENSDGCRGQWCVQPLAGGPARCSRSCNDDCPIGWDCRNFAVAGGAQTFLCVPPPPPCTACELDADCGGAPYECLSAWGGLFCGMGCGVNEECPEGYLCTTFGLPAPGCIPAQQCEVEAIGKPR